MENINLGSLDALLWTGEEANIELAIMIAQGTQMLPQWQTYQQLNQCVAFFERALNKEFSLAELIADIQTTGFRVEHTPHIFPDYLAVLSPIVRAIKLDSCGLTTIPPFVFKMRHLEELNLESNDLAELPDELFNFENLKILNINYNFIKSIPTKVTRLSQLTELRCISYEYCQLPDTLPQLLHLQSFSFGIAAEPTQYISLPAIIFECSRLTRLEITGLVFDALPATIRQLARLEELHIISMSMENLPDELAQLSNLQILNLTSLPYLNELPQVIFSLDTLRELNINDIPIETFSRKLAKLQQLTRLDISYTQIPLHSQSFWEQKISEWLPNVYVHWYP